jgi:hypothetical protein
VVDIIKIKKNIALYATVILFLYYTMVLLKRPCFFDWDEWSLIINFIELDYLQWLIQPHLGHILPIGKLFYSLELYIFRDHYVPYVITNLIIHIFNSYFLFGIALKVSKDYQLSLIGIIIYFISWNHIENLLWGMQITILFGTLFSILSLRLILANKITTRKNIVSIILLNYCSAFSFSFGIALPFFLILFVLFTLNPYKCKKLLLTLVLTQISIIIVYLIAINFDFDFIHKKAGINQLSLNSFDLDSVSSSVLYSIHASLFSFFYFITSIPVSLNNTEISSLTFLVSEFNIYTFIGSKKFFIIIIEVIFIFFCRYKQGSSFLYSIIIGFTFLMPFIILLSLTKSHYYESIFQPRYFAYLGTFIIIYIIKSVNQSVCKAYGIVFLKNTLILLALWNSYVSITYMEYSDYKINCDEVEKRYRSIEYIKENNNDIFFPASNPELTNREVIKIFEFMNK